MGRRIDWVKIKREYVESNITLEELAKKHNISLSTLKKRSARETWSTERNLFGTKTELKRQEKQSELLASEASSFDNLCLRVARSAIGIIENQINTLQEQMKNSKVDAFTERQVRLLEKLSNSLKQLQSVGKVALGENPENQSPLRVIVERVYSGND